MMALMECLCDLFARGDTLNILGMVSGKCDEYVVLLRVFRGNWMGECKDKDI